MTANTYSPSQKPATTSLFAATLVKPAIRDSFTKLAPAQQLRNPVMFVVYVGAILITGLWLQALVSQGEAPAWFIGANALWLWLPCCSRTSPRPWPKAAARRRPRACGN